MCHDKIEKSFEGTDDVRYYEIFGGISSTGEIEKMRKIVRDNGLNVVVGVGGGSAIDTAKATAYYEKLPVVIIPTVVATDAPCTGLSVIYNDDETFNSYLFYPKNPEAVIVDSDIIAKAIVLLKPIGFSVILFALNCRRQYHLNEVQISLRSNITRLWRIKLPKCP